MWPSPSNSSSRSTLCGGIGVAKPRTKSRWEERMGRNEIAAELGWTLRLSLLRKAGRLP